MRHAPAGSGTGQTLLLVLLGAALLLLPATAPAQALVGVSYTRQGVSAGTRHEGLSGYSLDVMIRTGPRLGLVFSGEQMGHGGDLTRDEFSVASFRAGLMILAARNRAVDLGFVMGVGLHSLSMDREEDGAGSTAFVQVQLLIHPVPLVGLQIGGIAQSMGGFGSTIGGNSLGLTLGLQLRGKEW